MGELKVLPLNDIRDLKGVISREFRVTGKPVAIAPLARRLDLSLHKMRKAVQEMGWVPRQRIGCAPQSYWDEHDESTVEGVQLSEQNVEAAVVHVPEGQSEICLATVTLEAYYVHIRNVWDELRHASSDPNLKDLQEDIASFKETTRQHLCEVMKKL